jgi:hypothetical protein
MEEHLYITRAELDAALAAWKREVVDQIATRLTGPQARSDRARMQAMESRESGIIDHLASIEERLLNLSFRRAPGA